MAIAVTIDCQRRELKTKGFLNQMKAKAMIPGVVYGTGMQPINLVTQNKQIAKILETHGSRVLFALEIAGEKAPLMAVIREIQRDPVSGQLIHMDFLQVDMSEKINSTIGIHISGEDELLKKNAVIQMGIKEIEISCLPGNLPDTIILDVAHLEVGDKVNVGDLQVPEGVEIITEFESLVAAVMGAVKEVEEVKAGS